MKSTAECRPSILTITDLIEKNSKQESSSLTIPDTTRKRRCVHDLFTSLPRKPKHRSTRYLHYLCCALRYVGIVPTLESINLDIYSLLWCTGVLECWRYPGKNCVGAVAYITLHFGTAEIAAATCGRRGQRQPLSPTCYLYLSVVVNLGWVRSHRRCRVAVLSSLCCRGGGNTCVCQSWVCVWSVGVGWLPRLFVCSFCGTEFCFSVNNQQLVLLLLLHMVFII